VVAFGRRGVADVTRRYTADFAGAMSRRTLVSEAYLQVCLHLGHSWQYELIADSVILKGSHAMC
jgi:hypothetical protein